MTSQLSHQALSLADYGWTPFFQSQLDLDDIETLTPVRVMAVHRGHLEVTGPDYSGPLSPTTHLTDHDEAGPPTVGDWLLIEPDTSRVRRVLDRTSVFKRRAAGTARHTQLIAANVDTLFIVSSCNQDFNIARLERYLALARDAQVTPIIVLTKADMATTPEDYAQEAQNLLPGLLVELVDARDRESLRCLDPWCLTGQTLAVVGSSGVGKSTLTNSLLGGDDIATQGIREDDAKGRHTTTGRAVHHLPSGAWLIDTPGMRELQLTDVQDGLEDVFADIIELSAACRFKDCQHETEPGCAVQKAIKAGDLDPARLARYRKLIREERFNSETLAERRARFKAFGKMVKSVTKDKKRRRGDG